VALLAPMRTLGAPLRSMPSSRGQPTARLAAARAPGAGQGRAQRPTAAHPRLGALACAAVEIARGAPLKATTRQVVRPAPAACAGRLANHAGTGRRSHGTGSDNGKPSLLALQASAGSIMPADARARPCSIGCTGGARPHR
jgi:hypothetical protein